MLPMLAESTRILPKNLEPYCAEQKFDGVRLVAKIQDREVIGYNRKGDVCPVPANVAAAFDQKGFSDPNKPWFFDGELMADNTYVLFDIMQIAGADIHKNPYSQRRDYLKTIHEKINNNSVLIAQSVSSNKINRFVDSCREQNAEGVILKELNSPYRPGKRSHSFLKYKFTKTIDVVVMDPKRKEKDQAVTVGCFDRSDLTEVGGCKIPEHLVGSVGLGDVLEIEYLYGTENNHVYQPVFLRLRTDKDPFECTMDQLIKTNKKVLSIEN